MRILITGAAGMLGTELVLAARSAGIETLAFDRAELDVTDEAAIEARLAHARPEVVINCAAWTDVELAEAAEEAALAVNGRGAGNVARAAAAIGSWTVHLSTDYVFDGAKLEPYVESDAPAPLSAYGRSKYAGELQVAGAAPDAHTIVRTSWLFGAAGRCFPNRILRLAAHRRELRIVDDQIGSPTYTGHLARALLELSRKRRVVGTVHVAGGGQCSWCGLAQAVVQTAGLRCEVRPGATADFRSPVRRPPYSVLHSERPSAPKLAHWREGLAEFMAARACAADEVPLP